MKDNVLTLGDPEWHFWLTRSVARAMGVNLSAALARGRLSSDGYADMVAACRKCPCVAHCEAWLATEAMQRCEAYRDCVNKPVLERLL